MCLCCWWPGTAQGTVALRPPTVWPEPQPVQPTPQPSPGPLAEPAQLPGAQRQPLRPPHPDAGGAKRQDYGNAVEEREAARLEPRDEARTKRFAARERAESAPATAADALGSAAPMAPPAPSMAEKSLSIAPQRQPTPPQAPRTGPVTAGMVDDNANFSDYLAFRDRTQVAHRPRDVSERYRLEVRDPQGRGVADAEVLVRSAQGHAMWARTDTQGAVWLHPNAFDPARA